MRVESAVHPGPYTIWHDTGRPCVFVGQSSLVQNVWPMLDHDRHEFHRLTWEQLQEQSANWISGQQFIVLTSDVSFKQSIVHYLESKQARFFSLIGRHQMLAPDIIIGAGTYVNQWNDLAHPNIAIGQHCVITTFNQFGPNVIVGDFCHVSAYCYLARCNIQTGCVVGLRSTIIGSYNQTINVCDYCNIISGSMVTKDIMLSGTYLGNRRSNLHTSINQRIV